MLHKDGTWRIRSKNKKADENVWGTSDVNRLYLQRCEKWIEKLDLYLTIERLR